MRTLQIGLEWFPEHGGGLDRYFQELVERAPGVGIKAHGLVAGRHTVAQESGGLVHSFAQRNDPLLRRLRAARAMVTNVLRDTPIDLVASHFALHSVSALDRIKVPLVVHFQGPWAQESLAQGNTGPGPLIKTLIERRVYRRADRCIVLSHAFKALLAERYGVDEARIAVSPGAVDTDRFATVAATPRSVAREALAWPVDRPIILAVRRLVRRMGLDDLIDAMRDIVVRYPDVLLIIAGRGPEATALAARVEAHGLAQNVSLIGFVPDSDLPFAYRAADLTITPTVALEGFGLITVEAMAAGTPAMVTPVGGLPEIVQSLAPDLVLPGIGARAIADGVTGWLGGALNVPSDAACRDHAETHFSWPVSLGRIHAVYSEALA